MMNSRFIFYFLTYGFLYRRYRNTIQSRLIDNPPQTSSTIEEKSMVLQHLIDNGVIRRDFQYLRLNMLAFGRLCSLNGLVSPSGRFRISKFEIVLEEVVLDNVSNGKKRPKNYLEQISFYRRKNKEFSDMYNKEKCPSKRTFLLLKYFSQRQKILINHINLLLLSTRDHHRDNLFFRILLLFVEDEEVSITSFLDSSDRLVRSAGILFC